jgi:hypothetical protein
LADSYAKAVRENPAATIENVDELVRDIKKAAVVRNVLCHGSWAVPDANGKSIPFFVDRKLRIFDTPIDIGYLKQTQMDLRDLICSVMDTVTHMGWQFPGGAGPGAPIIR